MHLLLEFKEDKTGAPHYILKSSIQFELEEYNEAMITLKEALQQFPSESNLYFHRSNLLLYLREYSLAHKDISYAITIAESDSIKYIYLNNRAAINLSVREFELAYADLLLCYQYDSTSIYAATNLSYACDEIGKYDEAEYFLKQVIQLDSSFTQAYNNLAYHYQQVKKYDLAIEYNNIVLQMNPNEAYGYSNRGFCHYRLENYKEALKDLKKSIKLLPNNSYAHHTLALIYLALDKKEKACESNETALSLEYSVNYGEAASEFKLENCKN